MLAQACQHIFGQRRRHSKSKEQLISTQSKKCPTNWQSLLFCTVKRDSSQTSRLEPDLHADFWHVIVIGEYWWMLVWDPESYHVRSRIGENLSTKKATSSGYALQHFYSPAKVDMLVAIQVTLAHLKGNVPHGKIMFTTSKPPTLREVNILVLKAMIRHVTCEKELNRFHHLYPTIQLLTKTSNITLIYLHHIQVEETHIETTQVQDRPAKLLWLVSKYGTSWKLLMRFHLSPWTSSCTWETNSRTLCKEWAGQGKTTWFLANERTWCLYRSNQIVLWMTSRFHVKNLTKQ